MHDHYWDGNKEEEPAHKGIEVASICEEWLFTWLPPVLEVDGNSVVVNHTKFVNQYSEKANREDHTDYYKCECDNSIAAIPAWPAKDRCVFEKHKAHYDNVQVYDKGQNKQIVVKVVDSINVFVFDSFLGKVIAQRY